MAHSCSCVLWHAGAPNITELTFDRESRTLTCTSTGGPATTVTWTKDGAVITPNTTHQQTQMIVDTVEGIYQNTLTIAQSVTGDNLYGSYSCTVENSRGSSNRIEFLYGKITYIVSYMSLYCFFCQTHKWFLTVSQINTYQNTRNWLDLSVYC